MKAGKVVGVVLIVAVLVAVIVGVSLLNNINAIIKAAVESEGPKVTGTEVLLNVVDINLGLESAGGELKQFSIANPAGFTQPQVFSAETIRVAVDPTSLVGDVIVMKDITIEGIHFYAEQKGLTTNLQVLQKNLDAFMGPSTAVPAQSDEPVSETDVRLMVENLKFADSGLHLTTEKYGSFDLKLPSFELSNLGDKKVGLSPAQLGNAIMQPLVKRAKKQAEKALKDRAKDEVKARAEEKLKEKLGDDVAEKLDGLKGLFGR